MCLYLDINTVAFLSGYPDAAAFQLRGGPLASCDGWNVCIIKWLSKYRLWLSRYRHIIIPTEGPRILIYILV